MSSQCDARPCGQFPLNNLLRCFFNHPLKRKACQDSFSPLFFPFPNSWQENLRVFLFVMILFPRHSVDYSLRTWDFQPSYPDGIQPLYVEGGLLFGGGGFFIPSRKSSPVSLRFHATTTLWFTGWTNVIAPGRLHSWIQHPQYQHSSGYNTIGGMFLAGFGIKTSVRHASTHALHPLHISESNSIAPFGVGEFGTI